MYDTAGTSCISGMAIWRKKRQLCTHSLCSSRNAVLFLAAGACVVERIFVVIPGWVPS
jgi:hypothetical protein